MNQCQKAQLPGVVVVIHKLHPIWFRRLHLYVCRHRPDPGFESHRERVVCRIASTFVSEKLAPWLPGTETKVESVRVRPYSLPSRPNRPGVEMGEDTVRHSLAWVFDRYLTPITPPQYWYCCWHCKSKNRPSLYHCPDKATDGEISATEWRGNVERRHNQYRRCPGLHPIFLVRRVCVVYSSRSKFPPKPCFDTRHDLVWLFEISQYIQGTCTRDTQRAARCASNLGR